LLEPADPRARTFPASWRDAAIRILYDAGAGGVRCPACQRVFRGRAELRRLQGDHITPFSRGGLTTWANLQLLCAACNLQKQAKMEGDQPSSGIVLFPALARRRG
jgi:5-methylcytosine-specific restriction endonuclease McrA